MPVFPNAKNAVLHDAKFVDKSMTNNFQVNYNVQVGESSGLPKDGTRLIPHKGIKTLLNSAIPEATHDSSAYRPQCHPGTREQYIQDITHWALAPSTDDSPPILWMKGPAGVGKSALANTCAKKIGEKLGASFFFSRNGRDDPGSFIPTIAYQLSTKSEQYHDILDQKIGRDETLVTKEMTMQFQELIAKPILGLEAKGKEFTGMVIIVDGLDECQIEAAQCEIIEMVAASVRGQTTPFKWAFFSRADPHIEATFSRDNITSLCRKAMLPISRKIDGEIKLYLTDGLRGIIRNYNVRTSTPWPSDDDIQTLVNASAGLYIYAATVLRFLSRSGRPEKQLRELLDSIAERQTSRTQGTAARSQPFAELDAFYALIMKGIPNDLLPSAQLLLFSTTVIGGGNAGWCAQLLGNVLGFSEIDFKAVCNRLHAVLRLQDRSDKRPFDGSVDQTRSVRNIQLYQYNRWKQDITGLDGYISFYHKSFTDFLTDERRSRTFCVKACTLANELFRRCLNIHHSLVGTYNFNSADLRLASNVPDSASSLTWPYGTEFVNSFLKCRVYHKSIRAMFNIYRSYPVDYQLLEELVDIDYRKMLWLELHPCGRARHFGDTAYYEPTHDHHIGQHILGKMPKHLCDKVVRPHPISIWRQCWLLLGLKYRPSYYVIGRHEKKVFVYRTAEGNLFFKLRKFDHGPK